MLLSEGKHLLSVGHGLLHAGEVIHPTGKMETKKAVSARNCWTRLPTTAPTALATFLCGGIANSGRNCSTRGAAFLHLDLKHLFRFRLDQHISQDRHDPPSLPGYRPFVL